MTRRYLDQRLRLPLLRAVDAVDAHGSLLKASAVLGVTQPALRPLADVEQRYRATCLEAVRLNRRGLVSVTPRRIDHWRENETCPSYQIVSMREPFLLQ